MYQNLTLFQTAHHMARHAGARQAVTAQNIANSDTPGYRARQIAPFSELAPRSEASRLKMTRPGHLASSGADPRAKISQLESEPAPNGNSVSLETEALRSVEIAREHNRAVTIYRHGMTVLRSAMGR